LPAPFSWQPRNESCGRISEAPGALVPPARCDSAFIGEAIEDFIVDTDHWRHFFLILDLVWGLTAASINLRRRAPAFRNMHNPQGT